MKSIIRNAICYTATLPSAEALEKHLEEHAFVPPSPSAAGSTGFVPRVEFNSLVDVFPGGLAFTVRFDQKVIPASALKAKIAEDIKKIEEETGFKPSKAAKKLIKEEAELTLRLKALIKTSYVTCMYDRKTNLLVVPTTSQKVADSITSLLINSVGSIKTETINVSNVKQGLTTRLDSWVKDEKSNELTPFGQFNASGRVLLQHGSQKLSVDVDCLVNAQEALREALDDGFQVKSISLQAGDSCDFVLTSEFRLKSIAFHGSTDVKELEDAWGHQVAAEMINLVAIMEELKDMFSYKEEPKETETEEAVAA